ncbi:MAG: porin [Arenicella sp.]
MSNYTLISKNKICTLAATASLLMASNASAVKLLEKDGFTLKLKGDYQLQLRKKTGETDNLNLEYDDLELKFHGDYNFGGGVGAFGVLDIDFKSEADSSDPKKNIDEAYVGLKFGGTKIGMGRANYAVDPFGVKVDYEMAPDTRFDNTSGDDVFFAHFALGGNTKLNVSTDIAEGSDGEVKDESSVDLMLTTKVAGLSLAVAYQDYKADGDAESVDTVGVALKGKAGGLGYGIAYSTNDGGDQVDLSLKSKLGGNLTGAIAYSNFSPEEGDSVGYWYANLTHAFHKQVKLFVEIGGDNKDDSDLGYVAGLRFRY